jgi:phage FluMu protein Com
MARPAAPRTVRCYHCGHALEVGARAMTSSCPACSKALRVDDVVVKTMEAVRKIQTCGKVIVHKSGRVFAQSVEAQEGVQCDGVMEANVLSRGPVRIGPKATWKGDCRAASLHIELGAAIVSGYFVVPCEADAAG